MTKGTFVTVLFMSLVGATGCQQQSLRDRLWNAVNDEMKQTNAAPMGDTSAKLAHLVDGGVVKIEADPTKITPEQAEKNIRRLVKAMIDSAAATSGQAGSRAPREIRDKDVDGAQLAVCPLYPFC